jgi:hypothetical protein
LAAIGPTPSPLAAPIDAAGATLPPGATSLPEASVRVRALVAGRDAAVALVRLGTAREVSRWSLRSSVAREGDEDVARVGVAWRVPRGRGETEAIDRDTETRIAAIERAAALEIAALAARWDEARTLLDATATAADGAASPSGDVSAAALAALEARWTEGKSRGAEILPLLHQILTAREAAIARAAERARAAITLASLTETATTAPSE